MPTYQLNGSYEATYLFQVRDTVLYAPTPDGLHHTTFTCHGEANAALAHKALVDAFIIGAAWQRRQTPPDWDVSAYAEVGE